MQIGEKTIERGGEMLTALMKTYKKKINDAFKNEGEKALKIGLSLDIEAGKASGTFKLEAGINFVSERIKDTYTDNVDEQQMGLFEQEQPKFRKCPVQGMKVLETHCKQTCPLFYELLKPDGSYPIPVVAFDPLDGSFLQERPCAAWADDFTMEGVKRLLAWNPPEQEGEGTAEAMKTYRIRHKQSGEWWEGEAATAANACILAGWNVENCEIKIRNSGGNWCKCRETEAEPVPCDGCANHRRKGNPKKGVTIPGAYGKCIREGGLCQEMTERSEEVAA